jgi:hypothetical protein
MAIEWSTRAADQTAAASKEEGPLLATLFPGIRQTIPDVVKQLPKGEARLDIEGKFDMGTIVWCG